MEEKYKKFIETQGKRIGENYGYNVEISVPWDIPNEVLNELYRKLWVEYAIDDLYATCSYCETCLEHHKETPYHFDMTRILSMGSSSEVNRLRSKGWSEHMIRSEQNKYNTIQNAIADLVPNENALSIREVHTFYNLAYRVKHGWESYGDAIAVKKSFLTEVCSLKISKINRFINQNPSLFRIFDALKDNLSYYLIDTKKEDHSA